MPVVLTLRSLKTAINVFGFKVFKEKNLATEEKEGTERMKGGLILFFFQKDKKFYFPRPENDSHKLPNRDYNLEPGFPMQTNLFSVRAQRVQ